MEWKAAWIWDSGEANPWNYWLCAHKEFQAPEGADLDTAVLHITADTRYVLWINGERIGEGPVRAWPAHYRYDTYDLGAYLRSGRNVIAVLVHHYGVGTFQSLPTRAGLLAQLEWEGKPQIVTDASWKVAQNNAFDVLSPRISCQQGWVENIEAYYEPPYEFQDSKAKKKAAIAQRYLPLWYTQEFDDRKWRNAVVIGPAGMAPWTNLRPRDIPLLTQEPVYPVAVLETRRIRTLDGGWFINVRRNLLPDYLDSGPMSICGLLAVRLVNERGTVVPITFHCPGPGLNVASRLRVNGVDVERVRHAAPPWDNGFRFSFDLPPGENLLMWDLSGHYHEWAVGCVADIPDDVRTGGVKDAVYGPFASPDDPDFVVIWNAASFDELKPFVRYKSTRQDWVDNPFLPIAYARPLEGKPRIENVEALCAANEDVASIYPDIEEETVEILLDFGRMTVGYWEFELFAPREGAHLRLVGFESIQDSVWDFCWGMSNALSYMTREGWQTFQSTMRRGCRYLLLTIDHSRSFPGETIDAERPVRIRSVRTILNTYPVVERGTFSCSDDRLNAIWKMGQWTTRLCMEDTFVDCPTYEQTFWVGDSRNEGAVNHVAFGEYALTRRSLLLAAESLERSPIVEALVPSAWKAILPCWSFLWALACEEFYQVTGDLAFVREIYPAMAQQACACLAAIHENDLFAFDGWQMLDWAPMDVPNDGFITHINAWLVESLRRTARLADLLGHADDARDFLLAAERVKSGINAHLWDETRQAYVDCLHRDGTPSSIVSQQTNTVVLLCDCAPADRLARIEPYVEEAPEGFVRVGSPFMTFFTFEALARRGAPGQQRILDLIRERWGFMLDCGATTCWETFPGHEPEGRWTRSHCHAWSAAPTYFLSAYQLGVRPLEPGFARALIAPEPADLRWARGRVPTPHGPISVDWQREEDGRFVLTADLSPHVAATVRLPAPSDGQPDYVRLEVEGGTSHQDAKGVWEVDVPAGNSVRIIASS